MAKNNAVILIKGEQVIDGEHDVTEIDVTGDLSETDGGLKLEFWEYLDDKEKVHTEIVVDGDTVIFDPELMADLDQDLNDFLDKLLKD